MGHQREGRVLALLMDQRGLTGKALPADLQHFVTLWGNLHLLRQMCDRGYGPSLWAMGDRNRLAEGRTVLAKAMAVAGVSGCCMCA